MNRWGSVIKVILGSVINRRGSVIKLILGSVINRLGSVKKKLGSVMGVSEKKTC